MSAVEHATFVIERRLPASPKHAFRFWSEPAFKARWNECHPDWAIEEERFDFRVGGGESKRWRTGEGHIQTFDARYYDIVPGVRIIYAYDMTFKGERMSASLATIEFAPAGKETRMLFTEQVAFLGGVKGAREQRIVGTEGGFDRLIEILAATGAEVS